MFPAHFFAIHEAVQLIFGRQLKADRALELILKADRKRGQKDRAIIAENTYAMVRWWRLLNHLGQIEPENLSEKANGLRIGLWYRLQKQTLPPLRELKPALEISIPELQSIPHAFRASIPVWLEELGNEAYGERWPAYMELLNRPAELYLRINTLKISPEVFFKTTELPVEKVAGFPEAARAKTRISLQHHPEFKAGLVEVQDIGSQQIAPFLEVQPGMRVIDACAGGGGKSLHLAALMQNKGRIVSMDVYPEKLQNLKLRARRAGIGNIEPRLIASSKVIKHLKETADRLLLDVPCSGLGVLRRNPDAKWKMNLQKMQEVMLLQQQILEQYCNMLKPGGKMVYATCSVFPDENENQIKKFLSTHPEFEMEAEKHIIPDSSDGFYMARLVKTRRS